MKNKIEPTILKGTRDFLPADMAQRDRVMSIIKNTFQQFGYGPIETPILSKAETILGKDNGQTSKMAYSFKDYGDRDIALPFDLTMPFARFVAANYQDLPIPFKRFQIQRVWRAERPQKGRLREFYQCDVDIIGSNELRCEAEIAKLIVTVFDRLKIKDIVSRINSRRLLNEVLSKNNVPQTQVTPAIRLIDKLDKIGEKAVIDELVKIGISGPERIIQLLKPEKTNADTLKKLADFDLAEIKEFLDLTREFDLPDKKIKLDPSLARGLDYYTGLTFEVISKDTSLGTICAGGRYDDLCSMFSDKDFSGIGVSFGFERIMILLDELGLLIKEKAPTEALVTVFDEDSLSGAIKIYNTLLAANLPAEIYLSQGKLAKQLKFADKKNIPFVIIQGPDEKASHEVIIRRMANGNQKKIPLNQLVSYISGYYESE